MKNLKFVSFALLLVACGSRGQPIGPGNPTAARIASGSPLIQSTYQQLVQTVRGIGDDALRTAVLDELTNAATCIQHRANLTDTARKAVVQQLVDAQLVPETAVTATNLAGVFPPVLDDGTACPHLPQAFTTAPGGTWTTGHHGEPGGLVLHTNANVANALKQADTYVQTSGLAEGDGLPAASPTGTTQHAQYVLNKDVLIAAAALHDWTKTLVFQWNADGSEFTEYAFGGNGTTDSYGAPGSSVTGGHHLLAIAESMVRGLGPEVVVAQASAHQAPSVGNEYKVVNWLRAAAIIARIDPVAKGYLRTDAGGKLRLPALRQLANPYDLNALPTSRTNILPEYIINNLVDTDYLFTGHAYPVLTDLLSKLAPAYGFDPAADPTEYNFKFRNTVLSYLSAERLYILYVNGGSAAVTGEIDKLRAKGIL